MKTKAVALMLSVSIVFLSIACGGAGDGEPTATFRSLNSYSQAVKGQYVVISVQLSNVPQPVWTIFADTDENTSNGYETVAMGTDTDIEELWDTTAAAAGYYYIGIFFTFGEETYQFYTEAQVQVIEGTTPVVTITEPSESVMIEMGDILDIAAQCTDYFGFNWEFFASVSKNPLSPSFMIKTPAYANPVSFQWDTTGVGARSFYIGAIARDGDVLSYGFTPFLVTVFISDYWEEMGITGVPSGRYDHKAVWANTGMLIWGGRDNYGVLNDGAIYYPWASSWEAVSDENAPETRENFTATWCDDRMIVWGGDYNGTYINTGSMYFPNTDTWVPMSTVNAPSARSRHAAVWTSKYFIVWGGEDSNGLLNTGGIYDPETDTWTAMSSLNAPSGRTRHVAAWVNDGIIVWGGRGFVPLDDGAHWDIVTDTWTTLTSVNAPSAREQHYGAYLSSQGLVIFGGKDQYSPLTDGAVYNKATGVWTTIHNDGTYAPDPYIDGAVSLLGKYLFVWGGYWNGYSNSGAKFNLDTWMWESVTTLNQPEPRRKTSATWIGSVIMIWGGQSNGGPLNTGSFYFP